jgi:peroxiredoxin-like protein
MSAKMEKQFVFETHLNWLAGNRAVVSAEGAEGAFQVATPAAFGGEGGTWAPEHLLLASISSCFMTTYLALAKKFDFRISHFECEAIGQIKMVDGMFKFTAIDIYPGVYIHTEELREKASIALEKTKKYCIISNTLNAELFYHSKVVVAPILWDENGNKSRVTAEIAEEKPAF